MPNWSDQITEKLLSQVAQAYIEEGQFDVFKAFPKLDVTQKAGAIGVYTKADWLRIGDTSLYKRAGATESIGDDFTLSKSSYLTEQYSFHKDVTREEAENYDSPFNAAVDAVNYCMFRLKRVALKVMIDTVLTTGVWASDNNLTTAKWSDANVDPVGSALNLKQTVKKATGFDPNKMIMTYDVFTALKTHPKIIEKMKTTSDKVLTKDLLARLFEVDDLFVFDAVNETGTDFLTTKKVLFYYAPARPSRFAPSAAYFIVMNKRGFNVDARKIPMPHLNDAIRVEVDMDFTLKVIGSDLGVFAYNVV